MIFVITGLAWIITRILVVIIFTRTENYLNSGIPQEFMPLDNCINDDIKRLHDCHCTLTTKVYIRDPRRFSIQTPRLISRGIQHFFSV